jgi:Domain of unknown function (DUF4174)
MKTGFFMFLWILATSIAVATTCAFAEDTQFQGAALKDLSELQWKNRVILVHTGNSLAQSQLVVTKLLNAETALNERDVVWFLLAEDGVRSNYGKAISGHLHEKLSGQYFPDNQRVNVVLIGKDGGVKLRQMAFDLNVLLQRIDAMPMRKKEMEE